MANEFIVRKGLIVSGSSNITGSLSFTAGGVTGSLFGTASWAQNVVSASYAQTSSVALKVRILSGSVYTANALYSGSFSGSFIGDGSGLTGVGNCTISGSAPTVGVESGDLWYDDTTGKTYIYYTSASVSSWVLQSDPTYDPGLVVQAATASLALAIPTIQPVTPITGSIYFSGGLLYVYDGTQYRSASLN